MNLKKDMVRFKLHSKVDYAFVTLPLDTIWAICAYPEGKIPTVILYTENENFEVVGVESEVLSTLGWLDDDDLGDDFYRVTGKN